MYHHYDWIIIMGYSRHELGKIIMLYSPKKICHITPLPLHNGHLSTTLFCPQGGCSGEVWLYKQIEIRIRYM